MYLYCLECDVKVTSMWIKFDSFLNKLLTVLLNVKLAKVYEIYVNTIKALHAL